MEAGGQHHTPHFHAYYGSNVAIVGLDTLEVIAGGLPRTQTRLVLAWAEIHHQELLADWDRLQSGLTALPIQPLA